MDAWLGRPRQYDRKGLHDGFKNTYSFITDGVWMLAPLKQKVKSLKCLETHFSHVQYYSEPWLINMRFMFFWLRIRQPLNKFKDVVPNEIPIGLAPIRNIQYQIDLVPRVAHRTRLLIEWIYATSWVTKTSWWSQSSRLNSWEHESMCYLDSLRSKER